MESISAEVGSRELQRDNYGAGIPTLHEACRQPGCDAPVIAFSFFRADRQSWEMCKKGHETYRPIRVVRSPLLSDRRGS